MESFFRKLQEVTELPGEASGDSSHRETTGGGIFDAFAGVVAPSATDDKDVETLEEQLREARRELSDTREKWSALKSESAGLQEEYAAYKAKVQTWREQMRVARAQDRKTIELLRQTQSSDGAVRSTDGDNHQGASSSSAVNSGKETAAAQGKHNVEEVYVKSLEDQVKQLKESIRSFAGERDQLQLELRKVKDAHREDLIKLSYGGGAASSSASLGESHGNDEVHSHEVRMIRMQLENCQDDLRQWQARARECEERNEQLVEDAHNATDALNSAISKHRREMEELQWSLEGDKTYQYIQSLEGEVRMWKAEAQIAKSGLTPLVDDSTRPDSSRDRDATVGSLSQGLSDAKHQLAEKDRLIHELRQQVAELSTESSLREESIDHMYMECRELETRLQSAMEDLRMVNRDKADLLDRSETLEQQMVSLRKETADMQEQLVYTQTQYSKLQKENSNQNETLRGLKSDLAKRLAATSALEQPRQSSQPEGPTEGVDASTRHGEPGNLSDELAQLLQRHQMQNVLAVQRQVHAIWTQLSTQRKKIWTNSRWKLYVVGLLFILLVLLFSMYQAMRVTQAEVDDATLVQVEQQLKECLAKVKATA